MLHDETNALRIIKANIPVYTGKDVAITREVLGLNVWDVADLLEVSRTTLYRIEKENRQLSPAACLLIQYLKSFI